MEQGTKGSACRVGEGGSTGTRDAVLERPRAPELVCKVLERERAGEKRWNRRGRLRDRGGKVCCQLSSGTEEEMKRSRDRIRSQRMRPAGERAERNLTEPAGVGLALTSAGPLSRAAWQAPSKTPPMPITRGTTLAAPVVIARPPRVPTRQDEYPWRTGAAKRRTFSGESPRRPRCYCAC